MFRRIRAGILVCLILLSEFSVIVYVSGNIGRETVSVVSANTGSDKDFGNSFDGQLDVLVKSVELWSNRDERGNDWIEPQWLGGVKADDSGSLTATTASLTIWVPDNYTTIQAAVNAADEWTTINVRKGTYTENVVVNKTGLKIIGVDGASNTTVQSNTILPVFNVTAYYVSISGFYVTSTEVGYGLEAVGILVEGALRAYISDNVVFNDVGISLKYSNESLVSDNDVDGKGLGFIGIKLQNSYDNIVARNRVKSSLHHNSVSLVNFGCRHVFPT